MKALKIIRYIAWGGVAVLGAFASALALGWWHVDGPGRPAVVRQEPTTAIGGPFSLTDHGRDTITERSFLGRPFLVFFGFTHCPDVCPTTLFETTAWLQAAGRDADRIQVLFVSVDPRRDTPELLSQYLQSFDPRIIAASGTKEQIDAMVAAYRATYRFVPTSGDGYTVDHTASMFMMDSKGRFVGTIDFHENRETALAKIKRLSRL
jgi:protein SCO1